MIPVVIPYHKGKKRLKKCKKQLKSQTIYKDLDVHIVKDGKGSGYTPTVNRGLRHYLARPGEWDYIVICDQDMYLDPDALEKLRQLLDDEPNCGIAVSVQRLYDRPFFAQAAGLDCIPVGSIEVAHMSYFMKNRPIFWGDIACCMIRKECLWDIGLLDENFVFICSDSDLSLTARSKGWEVWLCGESRGIHQKGHSVSNELKAEKDKNRKIPPKLLKQMGQDQRLFRTKWESSGYYKILKYEKDRTVCVIKKGELIDIKVNEKGEVERKEKPKVSAEQAKTKKGKDRANVVSE